MCSDSVYIARRAWVAFLVVALLGVGLRPARAQQNAASTARAEPEERTIRLAVSEQTTLSANGVRSYSEGTRGIVDVRLTRSGDEFVLVGQSPGVTSLLLLMNDGEKRNFRIEVTDPAGLRSGEEGERIERRENIRLDFYFVQLNRSHDLEVGLAYPSSVSLGTASATFDFLSQSLQSATAVIENQALLRLDFAQSSGWAKLQRQAAVITENGEAAKFFGGGEVNIPVQGSLTTGIHAIDFGSTIEVLPRYDTETGRLQISLAAEVADLTDDRGSGAPGRVRSTLNTVVNLELGQAIVLAGMSAESHLQSRTGVPGLSQIPIVGLFFGGKKRRSQSMENVVFIVPTVIDTPSPDSKEKIEQALSSFSKYRGGVDEREKLRETWRAP